MKNMVAIVCLAFVACAFAADPSSSVISEMASLKDSTDKFADTLRKFLESDKKDVSKESKDRLKDLGGSLGEAESKLGEQMGKLGEFLELPKEVPPVVGAPQAELL